MLTAGLVLLVTAVAFEGLAAPTVLPATLDELRGVGLYGWAFSGFWLSNLVGITLAGAESDRRGPLLPFALGTVAFALGLLVAGVAPAMEWVVAGRVIQGLGAGAIGAITYVAIARGYEPRAQPRMIAIISSAWVLPGLLGPGLAGWLTETLSWRWAFLGLAPLVPLSAAAVVVPLGRMARSRTDDEERTDKPPGATIVDALLLATGSAAVLAAISWASLVPSMLLGTAGLLLTVRSLRRTLPAGVLTARPGRGAAIAVLALVSVAFFGVEAFIPLAVASVRGAGAIAGGLALTTAALTWAAGSWLHARLAASRSRRSVTGAGLVLIGIGIAAATAVPLTALAPIWLAAAAWAVAGLGMGLAYSTATLAVIESADAGAEGAASASIQLAEAIGIAFGTGAAGAIVAGAAAGPLGLASGIVIANIVLLVVLLAAIGLVRRMSGPAGSTPGQPSAIPEHGPAL